MDHVDRIRNDKPSMTVSTRRERCERNGAKEMVHMSRGRTIQSQMNEHEPQTPAHLAKVYFLYALVRYPLRETVEINPSNRVGQQ